MALRRLKRISRDSVDDHAGRRPAGTPGLRLRRQLVRRASCRASFATATSTVNFVRLRHQLTDGPPFEKEATSYLPPTFQRKAHKKICDPQCRALRYSGRRHTGSFLPRHRHRCLRLHQQRPRHKQTKKPSVCAKGSISHSRGSARRRIPAQRTILWSSRLPMFSLALLTPPDL